MKRQVIILQHVANESAGTILGFLRRSAIPYREVHLYKGDAVPSTISHIRSVVAMGGPMNVYEEEKYPFLKKENEFIKKVVRNGIPYLGICLGSQLLAKALGAGVFKARKPEIGWKEVELCEKDPLFAGIRGKRLKVLQWHEDTFQIPKGAVRLASSRLVPNQAFRYRDRFYGLQFHVELDRPILRDWFKKSPDLKKILSEFDGYQSRLFKISAGMFQSFFLIR